MTAPIRPDGGFLLPIEPRLPSVSGPAGGGGFADQLRRAVNEVGEVQQTRDDLFAAFMRGEPVDLAQVMAAAEEASISLEVLVEIRNKLQDAYRTIMSIQV